MLVMLILFCIFGLYLIFGEPLLRKWEYSNFLERLKEGSPDAQVIYYQRDALRNWTQVLFIVIVAFSFGFSLQDLGFRELNIHLFYVMPLYVKLLAIAVVGYYAYELYVLPCIVSRFNERVHRKTVQVLSYMKHLAPTTRREYFWWAIHDFDAITEEVIYRGFMFFFIPYLIPGVSVLFIFLVSACLDGLRFYPRPVIARYVFFSATCLCTLFIIFDSIWIPIFFSVIRYLKLFALPWYDVTPEDQKAAIGFIPQIQNKAMNHS